MITVPQQVTNASFGPICTAPAPPLPYTPGNLLVATLTYAGATPEIVSLFGGEAVWEEIITVSKSGLNVAYWYGYSAGGSSPIVLTTLDATVIKLNVAELTDTVKFGDPVYTISFSKSDTGDTISTGPIKPIPNFNMALFASAIYDQNITAMTGGFSLLDGSSLPAHLVQAYALIPSTTGGEYAAEFTGGASPAASIVIAIKGVNPLAGTFSYKRLITTDHTKCGNQKSIFYPYLFYGTYSYLRTVANGGKVQRSDGGDIAIYLDVGLTNLLAYDLIKYVPTTGEVEIRFTGTLLNTVDYTFYLAYGNAGASAPTVPNTAAYNSAIKALLPFQPNGSFASVMNRLTGTSLSAVGALPANATGKIDGGGDLTPTSGATGTITGADLSYGSIKAWIWIDKIITNQTFLTVKYNSNAYRIEIGVQSSKIVCVFTEEGVTTTIFANNNVLQSTFYCVRVYNRAGDTGVRLVINGVEQTATYASIYSFPADTIVIGSGTTTGFIDLVSVDGDSRHSGWFTTEYNNENDPSTFYSVGVEVPTATVYYSTLAGYITPTGFITRQVRHILSGSITPSGLLNKQARRALSGAFTPSGSNATSRGKVLDGVVIPVGTLSRLVNRSLNGTIVPVGTLIRSTFKLLAGFITPTGASNKTIPISLGGSVTPAGSGGAEKPGTLFGYITPSGFLTKRIPKVLSGVITPIGTLFSRAFRSFSGSITPVGTLNRNTSKILAGSTTPVGTLLALKSIKQALTGNITPTGTLSTLKNPIFPVYGYIRKMWWFIRRRKH